MKKSRDPLNALYLFTKLQKAPSSISDRHVVLIAPHGKVLEEEEEERRKRSRRRRRTKEEEEDEGGRRGRRRKKEEEDLSTDLCKWGGVFSNRPGDGARCGAGVADAVVGGHGAGLVAPCAWRAA